MRLQSAIGRVSGCCSRLEATPLERRPVRGLYDSESYDNGVNWPARGFSI